MSAPGVPPRPDLDQEHQANVPSPTGEEPSVSWSSVILAAVFLGILVIVAAALASERSDDDNVPAPSTAAPSPTARPSPSAVPDPPNLEVERTGRRLRGFPDDWYQLRAVDGSFRLAVREPTSVRDLADGGWEFDIGGSPAMYAHGRDIGTVLGSEGARLLARTQLKRWVRGIEEAGSLVPVTSAGPGRVEG